MKYCPEIGKIADTLFYFIAYFNENTVKSSVINRFEDSSFMADCHDEIKEKIPTLPSILAPIFYYQDQRATAISDFFTEQVDFANETIDSFLIKISSKSNILYSKIVDKVFPDDEKSDNSTIVPLIAPESYIQALNASSYSENFKLQISLVFGNFNYAISVLIEQLRLVYTKVNELYQKYTDKIDIVVKQIQSEKNMQLYKNMLEIDTSVNNEILFAITLMNQYTTQSFVSNKTTGLLLGFRHEDDLYLQFDQKNIDLRQILIAIGNDTRYSILQILMDREELTASSIAKILDLPPTTALRHVEFLYDSNVLYISRRSGLQIFYRINYDVLKSANKLITNKLGGKKNERTNHKESDQMD